MTTLEIALPLKKFLLIEHCPAEWQELDLYLFRDDNVAFYAGQSQLAFARVWQHLLNGFHGHSIIGRFVWANWPASMRFTIELFSSQSARFAHLGHDLNAAERLLIERHTPCFNISLNSQPAPIPPAYRPVNAPLRCGHSLQKLIGQAERAVQADENQRLLRELD